jgi:ABC-type dipeptide/oligopeptide/nickel transport system permease component
MLSQNRPLLLFIGSRLLNAVVTFFIVTGAVMAVTLLVPPEERARNYLPERIKYLETDAIRGDLDRVIEVFGLNDPFPIQYLRWLEDLTRGNWGNSPNFHEVFPAIAYRSPATLELTFYSLLLYIPAALVVGAWAAWRQGGVWDVLIRIGSYVATAIPPFIFGLILITIFYVQIGWFDLSRIGYAESAIIRSDEFHSLTGFITFDGMINLRPGISWEAVRHLVLPVLTLSAFHLASLILVTRASVSEELQKEYLLLARSLGMRDRHILFHHALRNALVPVLNHTAFTAAQVMTGVFVVEVIFNINGISELLTKSLGTIPDVPLALGVCVYSVIVVLSITLVLDVIQGLVDPRLRIGEE